MFKSVSQFIHGAILHINYIYCIYVRGLFKNRQVNSNFGKQQLDIHVSMSLYIEFIKLIKYLLLSFNLWHLYQLVSNGNKFMSDSQLP